MANPPAAESGPPARAGGPGFRLLTPLNVMFLAVPAAAALHYGGASDAWVFVASGVGIIPLAGYMGKAPEALAARLGPAAGGLLNATFGNAAEHSTAVLVAFRNRMDLSLQIAVDSSTQIALFVAPVLVFASLLMGHAYPLDLHFTPLEAVAVLLGLAVVSLVCHDGESNWLEGSMMLALHLLIGLAFYHLPDHVSQAVPAGGAHGPSN